MGVMTTSHLRKRGLFSYIISTQDLSEGLRAIRGIDRRCETASLTTAQIGRISCVGVQYRRLSIKAPGGRGPPVPQLTERLGRKVLPGARQAARVPRADRGLYIVSLIRIAEPVRSLQVHTQSPIVVEKRNQRIDAVLFREQTQFLDGVVGASLLSAFCAQPRYVATERNSVATAGRTTISTAHNGQRESSHLRSCSSSFQTVLGWDSLCMASAGGSQARSAASFDLRVISAYRFVVSSLAWPEPSTNHIDFHSRFQQMDCGGVTERVRTDMGVLATRTVFLQHLAMPSNDLVDPEPSQSSAAVGQKHRRISIGRTLLLQKLAKAIGRFSPERTHPPLVTFAMQANAGSARQFQLIDS